MTRPAAETLGRVGQPLTRTELARGTWDVIVVGAGHNGLTTAAYLARAGQRVLVLERREQVGGACTLEESWPGFRVSPCAYLVGLLHPKVVAELGLRDRGYDPIPMDPTFFVGFADGTSFTEWADVDRTLEEVRRLSRRDVEGYRRYDELFARMRAALRPPTDDDLWLGEAPPRELIEERLDGDDEAIGVLFDDSMTELLSRHFSDQRLIDALAMQGCIGTFASPFDAGTAAVHFHHSSGGATGRGGSWGYVRGGMGMISFALCDVARDAGATVVAGLPVGAIRPGEGVELDDGTLVRSPVVVSNADPKRTLGLVRDGVPTAFRERVTAIPMESPTVKVNFALRALPDFGAEHAVRATINVTRGVEANHESYLAARCGEVSEELWCELYCHTAYDPSIAPDGLHAMSAFCQYVPYAFADGSWETRRDEIGDRVVASIEAFAPGFGDLVVHREVLGPPDVEARIGLTGGHIFQGECLPDQLWDRRLGARTPVDGLYLCGAGTHPGGSVIAANGRNAAMAVLADLRAPQAVP